MSFKEQKIKMILIASLVVVTAVLSYFYFNSSDDSKETGITKITDKKFTDEELKKKIPSEIDSMLYSFGIKKEWIKDGKNDKKSNKTLPELWFAKEVSIPLDLSTIEVTANFTNMLRYYGLEETINEDPKTKNISADIYFKKDSLKKTIGNIKLNYTDKIKRDASDVCLILNNIVDFKSSDLNDVLNSNENFSIVLPLTNDKSDVQSLIVNSKKDFLLKFSIGKEDDVEADFKSGTEGNREWRAKIKSVSYEFAKTGGVIIDNSVKDFVFEEKIKDEFLKYKITAYKDTLLQKFASSNIDEKKIYDLFTNIINRTKSGISNNFYILNLSPSEFTFLDKEIANLKRRGYKFYSFKDMMRKMNAPQVKPSDDKKSDNPQGVKADTLNPAPKTPIKKKK
ncbi:MAG: hypothetical protein J0M18_14985 [Ignavibacteria bacterium]|nr:hypothetical protein [Ignavibacteria bacterium]